MHARAHTYMEPLFRGLPDERPSPLERPLDDVNLIINVFIATPDERLPLLKGHVSGVKGVALLYIVIHIFFENYR